MGNSELGETLASDMVMLVRGPWPCADERICACPSDRHKLSDVYFPVP